jgi:3-deoxy-D-manno-octulosonic acid kinase
MVRRLRHGGILAGVTRGAFCRLTGNRPLNELRIASQLEARGIRTPRVLAAAVYLQGPLYRGEVAREFVFARGDLASCLFDGGAPAGEDRSGTLRAAGALVGRMHRAGLLHPDLNLRNVLIVEMPESPQLEAWILDLEKCRLVEALSDRAGRRMLERFRRSASRFEAAFGPVISQSEWTAFREAYRGALDV